MVTAALTDTWGIPKRTPVIDVAGERIGSVIDADVYAVVVERGFFFPSEHLVPFADVDRYEDGKLFLKVSKAQVLSEHDTVD